MKQDGEGVSVNMNSKESLVEYLFHFADVLAVLHLDEIHHNLAADVPKHELMGNFLGRLDINTQGHFLEILERI